MRSYPGKAWPHPVLRPSSYGTDYPAAEFQVEIDVDRDRNSTALEVVAEFALSDPDLLELVTRESAHYVLLVRAPTTHYRRAFYTSAPTMTREIPAGHVSGRVEFIPFLVTTRDVTAFCARGWHPDFAGRTFEIAAGSVLAEDQPPQVYWVETADEQLLGSIFEHRSRSDIPNGRWECQLDNDRVQIAMSPSDSRRFRLARERVNHQAEGQYLFNGLYLPALLHVLHVADRDPDAYSNRRWFAALAQRLEIVGCDPPGTNNADRLVDAQKILDHPFMKMPVMATAEGDQ